MIETKPVIAYGRIPKYFDADKPPAYIRLLTLNMELLPWAVSQGNFEESTGLEIRWNPNTGAHDFETRIASRTPHGEYPIDRPLGAVMHGGHLREGADT